MSGRYLRAHFYGTDGRELPRPPSLSTAIMPSTKLMGMKDRLSALVHKVQEINRLNAMLIKDSLEFIGDVLRRTFSRQPNAALVYGQTGTVNPVTVESRLVNLNA